MQFEPNVIYHIFNQGNNKRQVFFERKHYLFFLEKMRRHLLPYGDLLCYCLMPNHFHWLFYIQHLELPMRVIDKDHPRPELVRPLNNSIGILLRSYTRSINKQYEWSGSLFRNETKARDGIIREFITGDSKDWEKGDYVMYCFDYIHNNPVKANLVNAAEDWEYSSASDYLGKRSGTLCDHQLARKLGLA